MRGQKAATSASGTVSRKLDDKPSKSGEYIADPLIVIPPDGGWGWLIVACSFYANFVCDGISFTFGIFLKEISEDFKQTRTRVSLANSISSGICYLAAPFVCSIINRYGFMKTGFLGGLISTVSVVLSRFRFINFPSFLAIYGALSGIGICMLYCSSIVIVSFYFNRWRALSVSIAVCGSSTGIMVFPVIFKTVCAQMHWRTKFLILGGFCVFASIFTLTFRPVKPKRLVSKSRLKIEPPSSDGKKHSDSQRDQSGFFRDVYTRFHNLFYPTTGEMKAKGVNFVLPEDDQDSEEEIVLLASTDTKSTYSGFSIVRVMRDRQNTLSTIYEESSVVQNKHAERFNRCCACYFPCCVPRVTALPTRPMYRDDIFYGGSLATLKSHDAVSNHRPYAPV